VVPLRAAAGAGVAIILALGLAGCGITSSSKGPAHTVSAAIGGAPSTAVDNHVVIRPKPTPASPAKKKTTKTTVAGATVGGTQAPPPPLAGQVTFVGDSVGVDAEPYLDQDIPGVRVYAMVDRGWGAGEEILQGLAAQGELGTVVVVELGLNGPIEDYDFVEMMSILAHVPRVVFLNIRLPVGAYGPGTDWWQDQNNTVLATEIPHYRNAVLANWYEYSAGHGSWYAGDGIHLNPSGGAAMAELVKLYA
jgi:hypothetical protein